MTSKIKVVTQNCFFGKKVKEVQKLIMDNPAHIYCFQEVSGRDFTESIKKVTKINYILSAPMKTYMPNLCFHNAIFSKVPIIDSGELSWLKKRRRWLDKFGGKSLWADLQIGKNIVRVYNCYFSVADQGTADRRDMILDIIDHAKKCKHPVVISGDLNTVIPDKKSKRWLVQLWHRFPTPTKEISGDFLDRNEKYYFLDMFRKRGFSEVSDATKNTWVLPYFNKEIFNLKLDWLLEKGFAKSSGTFGPWIGDHRAIIGDLMLKKQTQ